MDSHGRKTDGITFYENDGLRNQAVLYRTRSLDKAPEVFLDPNTLSDDGTVALTGVFFSHDGRHAAYTISRSGSDWTEIYVMDTDTKQLLPDHIEWAKFTGADWQGDGFYYSAYPAPEKARNSATPMKTTAYTSIVSAPPVRRHSRIRGARSAAEILLGIGARR